MQNMSEVTVLEINVWLFSGFSILSRAFTTYKGDKHERRKCFTPEGKLFLP